MVYHHLVVLCLILISHLSSSKCRARECPGTAEYLDGRNVLSFDGCERVNGSIIINQHSIRNDSSFPITPEQLSLLKDIREIHGYLSITNLDHMGITDLRFLRRLQVIYGYETLEQSRGRHYALVIENNPHLATLSLASLERVVHGGVLVEENPELCLVDTITVENYLVHSQLARIGGLGFMSCFDVDCHEECERTMGCWGTLPDECVMCRRYKYMDTCIDSCNTSLSYSTNNSMECLPLHLTTTTTTTATISTELPGSNDTHIDVVVSNGTVTTSTTSTSPSDDTNLVSNPQHLSAILVVPTLFFITVLVGVLVGVYIKRKLSGRKLLTEQKQGGHRGKYVGEGGEGLIPENPVASNKTGRSISSLVGSKFNLSAKKESLRSSENAEEDRPGNSTVSKIDSQSYTISDISDHHDDTTTLISHDSHITNPSSLQIQHVHNDIDSKADTIHQLPRPQSPGGCTNIPNTPRGQGLEGYSLVKHLSIASRDDTEEERGGGEGGGGGGERDEGRCNSPSTSYSSNSWKPPHYSMGLNRFSPGLQHPMTMGGVYSTGHHHHHHYPPHRSQAGSQRGSLASYGTGASTRTSARTSRNTSLQSSSLACSSGVFEARN